MEFRAVLTDEQWIRISRIFERAPGAETRGRPAYRNRDVFECVIWVIANGAPWSTPPARTPDFHICHLRFKMWSQMGLLAKALQELFGDAAETMRKSIAARSRLLRRRTTAPRSQQPAEAARGA
ncbi:transposase [Paraburkholderia fungorum]|uniref:transposase n=1 Tax=Paraburkholderia fungorum TaxID=134537 RepID=UPI0038BBE194